MALEPAVTESLGNTPVAEIGPGFCNRVRLRLYGPMGEPDPMTGIVTPGDTDQWSAEQP